MTADRRPEHDSGQKRRGTRCRGHGHGDGTDTGGDTGHGVTGWVVVAMIRVATLVLCYLMVLVTTVRVIPVTGVFLYENSGVGADTPLNAQITFWLIPFCFLVLLMLIAEVTAFRALWALGSHCTARMRRTRHTGPLGDMGPAQRTRPQGRNLPQVNLPRSDARRAR